MVSQTRFSPSSVLELSHALHLPILLHHFYHCTIEPVKLRLFSVFSMFVEPGVIAICLRTQAVLTGKLAAIKAPLCSSSTARE